MTESPDRHPLARRTPSGRMELDAVETGAGRLYVDRSAGRRGSKGPFFHAFADETGDDRWGYVCGNCGAADNAVDTMGRVECNACGNVRKGDDWDDVSY
ncbi:MAG: DUF5816 domain-containing protein [Halobaculum sp.]